MLLFSKCKNNELHFVCAVSVGEMSEKGVGEVIGEQAAAYSWWCLSQASWWQVLSPYTMVPSR